MNVRTKSTQGCSLRLVVALAVIILLAFVMNGYFAARAEWRLRSQLAAIRAAGDPASIADLSPRAVPDDENAAAIMKQIEPRLLNFSKAYGAFFNTQLGKKYDQARDRGEPAAKEQIDAIRDVLADFDDVETAIEDASNCDEYASQLDFTLDQPALIAALIPTVQNARTASRLLAWRNEVLVADGKYDGAIQNGIEALRFARLHDEEPTLVSYLVSIAMRGIAVDQLYDNLASGRVSPRAHAALDRELALHDDPNRMVRALKTERALGADWINSQMKGGYAPVLHYLGWKLKSFESEVIDSMNDSVRVADQPWYKVRPMLNQMHSQAQPSNSRILANLMEPAVQAAFEANARWLAQLRALRIDNALCEFAETNGHDASGLEGLKLSQAATLDPYSGQPLKLKRIPAGWIVYSVMENGIDDGGDFTALKDFGVGPANARSTQKPGANETEPTDSSTPGDNGKN
jgi:hypothetical protein